MTPKKKSPRRKTSRGRPGEKAGPGHGPAAKDDAVAPAGQAMSTGPGEADAKGGHTDGKGLKFPLVGVGASAGGVEAFTDLLSHLPADPGLAFVLVQHLSPVHVSILAEVLGRVSLMPVTEVTDGIPVEINHVYVIPPNTDLAIQHGVLRLMPRTGLAGRQRLPIDYFFHSLAADMGPRAIGVILSGTASDGALGLKAIKAEGGITMAQDERTAKYNGMPRSAVAAGFVDFVLPPPEIAAELVRIGRHSYPLLEQLDAAGAPSPGEDADFNKILVQLRGITGVDFTYYKLATIKRRILRRMLLQKIQDQVEYLKFLQAEPQEVWSLYNDILISVTGFFRDHESFDALSTLVFPRLLEGRAADDPIRVWVPGCSTGEEAYSIAICLLEQLGDKAAHSIIQIFATDISDLALEKARTGIYPEGIAVDVSTERLRRFFTKTEDGYQIKKSIRDLCIFARQNVYKDPPFSRLDLISCRNVLIYLGSVLHKKVFPIFFYALKRNGMLFLGSSETIGSFSHLFSLVDKKHKVYQKKSATLAQTLEFAPGKIALEPLKGSRKPPARTWPGLDVQKEAERILLARFAPDGVILNADFDIIHVRGRTGDYLEPATGDASLNVLKMAREGLLFELRNALLKAKREETPVRKEGVSVKNNGKSRLVNIDVIPIREHERTGHFYLVVFETVPPPARAAKGRSRKAKAPEKPATQMVREATQLKQELAATREYLQSIIEEQEATNEELRSANEEIQSSNEELQSTNEEMETAKEELQSTNEELNTVNEALESRNEELTQLNDDLLNLLTCVQIPVIMLGNEMRLRRFTPAAERILGVLPSDVGRVYFDAHPAIDVPDLEELIRHVMGTLESAEREVKDRRGCWYTMRVRPYKTAENRIEGVVLAFYDIEEQKRVAEQLQQHAGLASRLLTLMPDPAVVLDREGRVVHANPAFVREFHLEPGRIEGKILQETGEIGWSPAQLQGLLDQARELDGRPVKQQLRFVRSEGGELMRSVALYPVARDGAAPDYFVLLFRDPG